MGKFNKPKVKVAALSPIVTGRVPTGRTHEGAPGYARDAKGELFLLAVSNMSGEETFYEAASGRDNRFAALIHEVALADPQWTAGFLGWLRSEANMRSASLAGALEASRAMLAVGIAGGRQLVASVLQRADEPGEALAYWVTHYGRAIPKPVKRGVADAVGRLYTEYALLKYDTASKGFRFADVIDLAHPAPVAPWQGDLFKVALERRHLRDTLSIDALPMLVANAQLRAAAIADPAVLLDAEGLRAAGMTWEDTLSLAGSAVDKAQLWEALIPSMGFMALLRNLRNFDEAGVSDEVAQKVAARLADPAQVARSRQFPFRFLAAYEQAPSLRWGHALDKALQTSLVNLPTLPGRTLILVDTSASMTQRGMSARSKMTPAKAAAVFGVALAAKGERVDLRGFADGVFAHEVPKGASVIKEIAKFTARTGEVGHGTQIAGSLRASFKGHDRVVIISDMQTMDGSFGKGVAEAVPPNVPIYGFNLGGYKHAAYATGSVNRHEFGGLTDATFRMIPLLESGRDASWPWR
jgi:hypothetical protein